MHCTKKLLTLASSVLIKKEGEMYKPITFQQKKLCCVLAVHITFILCFIPITSCDELNKLVRS